MYNTTNRIGMSCLVVLMLGLPSGVEGQVGASALRDAARAFSPIAALTILSTGLDTNEVKGGDVEWSPVGESFEGLERANVELRRLDEFWFPVQSSVSARRLETMYQYRSGHLAELNPDMDVSKLSAGDHVLVWKRTPERSSASVGTANQGRLLDGVMLPPGDAYRVIFPHRAFGTEFAVSEIVRVMDGFSERYGDLSPMIVGDLSFRKGGAIVPHLSHQSGRDVDISYPRYGAPANFRRFHPITRRTLRVEESLWLLKSFIEGGQVEYIFVDRQFQRLLRKEAERQGAPESWLRKVFQYRGSGGAIIRHAKGHKDHFHIRFRCQEQDSRCR